MAGLVDGRAPANLSAMYAAEDWSKLSGVEVDQKLWRLYACKCSYWQEASEHLLVNDGDSAGDPHLPWICDGHESPALPVTLGVFVISESGTNWADVVARILGGVAPRRLELADEGPSRWLLWLRKYLDGLAITSELSKAVTARLGDRDGEVVAAALVYVRWFSTDPGVLAAVLDRAEADLEGVLVAHVMPERLHRPRMWDVLFSALPHADELRARVMDVIRAVMLLPAKPDDRVEATLENDADAHVYREDDFVWMARNIVALDEAGPGRWRAILELLLYAQRNDAKLGYLVGLGAVALLQRGRVPVPELRAWMAGHGDSQDPWTLPIEAAMNGAERAARD